MTAAGIRDAFHYPPELMQEFLDVAKGSVSRVLIDTGWQRGKVTELVDLKLGRDGTPEYRAVRFEQRGSRGDRRR